MKSCYLEKSIECVCVILYVDLDDSKETFTLK